MIKQIARRLSSILFVQGFTSGTDPRIEGSYSSTPEEYSLTIIVRDANVTISESSISMLTAAINAAIGADVSAAVKLLEIDIPSNGIIYFHIVIGRSAEIEYYLSTMQ